MLLNACWIFVLITMGWAVAIVGKRFFKKDGTVCTDHNNPAAGWKNLIMIAGIALLSRLILSCSAYIYVSILKGWGSTDLVTMLKQWDASNYLYLAEHWYTADKSLGEYWYYIVFFPFYPMVVSFFHFFIPNVKAAGVVVSWISTAGAAVLLYRLVYDDYGQAAAKRAVKYLLIFPVTIFLCAQYTEALFLLLSLGCFYALRKKQWIVAALCGMLASATRNTGIVLMLPFLIEVLEDGSFIGCTWKGRGRQLCHDLLTKAGWALLIPLGLLFYLWINYNLWGDPLFFMDVQRTHWGQSFGSVAGMLETTIRYATQDGDSAVHRYLWVPQIIAMAGTLAALPVLVRKMRLSHSIYLIVSVIIIFSPTWLLSGWRYLLSVTTLFPAIAIVTRNKYVDAVLTIVFLLAMLYMTSGYVVGSHVL